MNTDNINPLIGDIIKAHSEVVPLRKHSGKTLDFANEVRMWLKEQIHDNKNLLEDSNCISAFATDIRARKEAYENMLEHVEKMMFGDEE